MGSPVKILFFSAVVSLVVGWGIDPFMERFSGLKKTSAPRQVNHAQHSETVRVARQRDGHYWVELRINDRPVVFVVDTGASHISLSYEDADRVGLNPDYLEYDQAYRTANGISRKAIVRLDDVSLGPIQFSNLQASVSKEGALSVSLLGMNFLSGLQSFRFENNELHMTQ